MNNKLTKRASASNETMYQVGMFIFLGLIVIGLFMGEVPLLPFALYAGFFDRWLLERTKTLFPEHVTRINQQADSWTLHIVLFSLFAGYVATQLLSIPPIDVTNVTVYGIAHALCIRGMARIYAMRQEEKR